MTRDERWFLRSARIEDVPALVRVINSRYRLYAGEDSVTVAELAGHWENPRLQPERDMCVLQGPDGVIGWGEVEPPGPPFIHAEGWVCAAPGVSADPATWDLLLGWALERARDATKPAAPDLRTAFSLQSLENDAERRRAYERAGFSPVRAMHRMRIDFAAPPASPVWPPDVEPRMFDPGRDLKAMCVASEEAFRDHWGRVPWTLEEEERNWLEWIRWQGDAFDPTLSTLAWHRDEVVGFALGRPHLPLDRTRGIVASLAVRPAWRKKGLGSALLGNALCKFHRRGCRSVELLVDSESLTGALRLYERAGMRAFRTQLVYERELQPGRDIVTRD